MYIIILDCIIALLCSPPLYLIHYLLYSDYNGLCGGGNDSNVQVLCTNVAILDDNVEKLTERFSVKLSRTVDLNPRIILDPVVAEVEIIDDDGE